MLSGKKGAVEPLPFPIGLLRGGDQFIDLGQQGVYIDPVNHAGLFHTLSARGRTTQTVHPDCHKNGRSLWGDIQDIPNNRVFGNLSHT